MRSPVDIIVCVHNSFDDVKACLESVLATISDGDQVIIVDDGSQIQTQELCKRFATENPKCVKLIRHDVGNGFCKAANVGLRASDKEAVILLNSDTIVVGDWLDKLCGWFQMNSRIGVVGPLSNAGGWQSIPELPGSDSSPNNVKCDTETLSEINAFCAELSLELGCPVVEQVNGFCFGIKRSLIDAIGLFDEVRFPQGYGEENDYNLRAQDAGFLCVVAVDSFVFHAKTKSYSSERRAKLTSDGQKQLRALYGRRRIVSAAQGTQQHPVLVEIREKARNVFAKNRWRHQPTEKATN